MFKHTNKAIGMPNPHIEEVDYDWLCPECYEIMQEEGADPLMEADVLKCVCMHCMNRLLQNCEKDIPDE
jgi:hypothetical protein